MLPWFSLLAFLGFAGSAAAAPPSPACALTATPETITAAGSPSTLAWTTSGATSVTLNGQRRSLRGSLDVKPLGRTGYKLVATNRQGRTCTAQVWVDTTVAVSGVTPLHSFWTGNDFDTTVSPQPYPPGLTPSLMAQYVLDNIINVTPTSKRPYEMGTNINVNRQIPIANRGGIKCFTGMGGSWGLHNTDAYAGDPAAELINNPEYGTLVTIMDLAIEQGCTERLYVDEPFQGYGCPDYLMHTDTCVARHVRVYNLMFDYAKSRVPAIKTGICIFDRALYLLWLRAGLHADFACLESYTFSDPVDQVFGAIHAEFPNVEKYHLLSDTFPLCSAYSGATTGNPPFAVTNAYWDVNQYSLWWAGVGLDLDWLKNVQEFQSTGQRQFCKNPRGSVDWNLNIDNRDDVYVNTYNIPSLSPEASPTMTKCEWKVVSFPDGKGPNHFLPSVQAVGVETLPWTEIPCAGNNPDLPGVTPAFPANGTVVKLTSGAGKLCRHNGIHACMVYYRVTNSLGRVGFRGFPDNIYNIP